MYAGVLQKLRGQVASLKGSRDKLLQEVDRQSLEIARLATENAALEQVRPSALPSGAQADFHVPKS